MKIRNIHDALMWRASGMSGKGFLVVNYQKVIPLNNIPLRLRGCLLRDFRCEINGEVFLYVFTKRRTNRKFWTVVNRSGTYNAITGEFNQ